MGCWHTSLSKDGLVFPVAGSVIRQHLVISLSGIASLPKVMPCLGQSSDDWGKAGSIRASFLQPKVITLRGHFSSRAAEAGTSVHYSSTSFSILLYSILSPSYSFSTRVFLLQGYVLINILHIKFHRISVNIPNYDNVKVVFNEHYFSLQKQ